MFPLVTASCPGASTLNRVFMRRNKRRSPRSFTSPRYAFLLIEQKIRFDGMVRS